MENNSRPIFEIELKNHSLRKDVVLAIGDANGFIGDFFQTGMLPDYVNVSGSYRNWTLAAIKQITSTAFIKVSRIELAFNFFGTKLQEDFFPDYLNHFQFCYFSILDKKARTERRFDDMSEHTKLYFRLDFPLDDKNCFQLNPYTGILLHLDCQVEARLKIYGEDSIGYIIRNKFMLSDGDQHNYY